MKIIIKKFNQLTPQELYKIIKLRVEEFIVDQNCIYQDLDDMDYYTYHHFIEHNDEILVYNRIFNKGINFKEASFGRFVSNKKYRGKGYGKRLLEETIYFIENELKENKIKIMAEAHAINFYKKFGFVEDGEHFLNTGILHVNMIYTSKNK